MPSEAQAAQPGRAVDRALRGPRPPATLAPVAFEPTGSRADIHGAPDYGPAARGSANGDQRLGRNWILLPLAALGAPFVALIVCAPIAVWRSRRRRPAPVEQLDEYYSSIGRMRDPFNPGRRP